MVKDREKQLQNVENEQKMDTVQDRFPNDDLHLQEKDKVSLGVAQFPPGGSSELGPSALTALSGHRNKPNTLYQLPHY